jgi:hypothetical protein
LILELQTFNTYASVVAVVVELEMVVAEVQVHYILAHSVILIHLSL